MGGLAVLTGPTVQSRHHILTSSMGACVILSHFVLQQRVRLLRQVPASLKNPVFTAKIVASLVSMFSGGMPPASAGDLEEVKAAGVLRHAGVPYANFVSGSGDGFDVELMQGFARRLGVEYRYIQADWTTLFPALTGRALVLQGNEVKDEGAAEVLADIGANGITVLDWRKQIVDFSASTFPTQVWLIARKSSSLVPIKPAGDVQRDIASVRKLMRDRTLFCKANTCLDPALYDLAETGTKAIAFKGSLNELAPAVIKGEAELTLLDVPDTLVALRKWPGEIKVIGPVGMMQDMAVAFPKSSPKLRLAFDSYLKECQTNGEYSRLVEKYYPYALEFFPDFFAKRGCSRVHEPGKAPL
jgi:ABC-type amino acid transport substrate-binding protein